MKLYHFTCREHLPKILVEGLTRGEVPLGPSRTETAVWFTTVDHAEKGEHGLALSIYDKTAVRITVDIPSHDSKLHRWSHYAKFRKVHPYWYGILDKTGGGFSHTWFIYRGIILPNKFLDIYTKKE